MYAVYGNIQVTNLQNMIVLKKLIIRMIMKKLAFPTGDQLIQFWHLKISQ